MKDFMKFSILVTLFLCSFGAKPIPSTEFIPPEQGQNNEFHKLQRYFIELTKRVQNAACQRQLKMFSEGIGNSTLWAVQMLDASAKIPIGLIVANTYQLGHYDECVQISTEAVEGKYCLADIQFAPKNSKYPDFYNSYVENQFSLQYDPYKSVWEKFKLTADPSKKRRDIFHAGICIPNQCSAADLQGLATIMLSTYASKYDYDVKVTVKENYCSIKKENHYPASASVVLNFLGFLLTAVVLATAWDLLRDRKRQLSRIEEMVESFSINRNIAKLSQPDRSNELDVFYGMKFYTIALICLGHRCVHTYGAPFFNPQFLEERYRKIEDMFLLNGSLIVDTFFMMGGYLTCYGLLKQLEAGKRVRAFDVYLYRWLRMTPMYMMVVFIYAYLLEHLGSGPVWNLKVGREAQRCRDNWWTNLFFINNYVNNKEMCMFQSWYVSCDMHYTLSAPFIVNALVKSPKKGIMYLATIITAATLVPFFYTYYYQHDGVLRVYMQIFEDLPHNVTFAEMYIKSHHRAVPYFIGMAGAYLFTRLQVKNFQFPTWLVWTGSFLSTSLSFGAIWGAWYFYIPGRAYSAMENASYAAIHRLAWALAMTWIPVAGGRRAFGIIQPILSKQALVPLSRLSFGAFLVHGIVQLYLTGSMRQPEYVEFPKLFWMTAGDIVLSFTFAFLLHILFEAPVNGITKFLLTPKKKRSIVKSQ